MHTCIHVFTSSIYEIMAIDYVKIKTYLETCVFTTLNTEGLKELI